MNDPVTLAALEALDHLIRELTEARSYLHSGEVRSAIGTLVSFDDRADDVRAAMRLLRMMRGRRP